MTKCYPDLESSVSDLAFLLDEVRSLLCRMAALDKGQAERKLADTVARSKADQSAIDEAEAAVRSTEEILTRCNIGAYHTRAIVRAVANIHSGR